MGKLLRFEFHKIFRQKSFYVCFGIAAVLAMLNIWLTRSLADVTSEIVISLSSLLTGALSSSSFMMILGIFTALYACDDFSNNTLKNIYARGYSRVSVFFSKYLASMIVSVIGAVICMALTYVLGTGTVSSSGETWDVIPVLLGQLCIVLAYHALYFSVAMIIGKVGGSVAFNLVGPSLIVTVLSLLTSILKMDFFKISSYWLDSAFGELTATATSGMIVKAIVMSAIYVVIFAAAGCMLSRRKEM